MRLINTLTYKLEERFDGPPYAILSHTWRAGAEVLYSEFVNSSETAKSGYRKIENLCKQARRDGLDYAWIDTACIDKSSSAELSEAINSMFKWYEGARVCYVYLDDADDVLGIQQSRWITRGWTLQELIAPWNVRFYDKDWNFLGTKSSLVENLVRWTRIDQVALEDSRSLRHISAATKMVWASSRFTSRIEDVAYCLLGIFDINMSLIYGEGERAFQRLQEEVLKQHHDLSLLAFNRDGRLSHGEYNFFAPSPFVFGLAPKIINEFKEYGSWTNRGLETFLPLTLPEPDGKVDGILPCRYEFNLDEVITIPLFAGGSAVGGVRHLSLDDSPLGQLPRDLITKFPAQRVLLLHERQRQYEAYLDHMESHRVCCVRAPAMIEHGYKVFYAEPETGIESWNQERLVSEVVSYRSNTLTRKFGFICFHHDEAFIIILTNVGRRERRDNVFVAAKVKPRAVHWNEWLAKEGMYEINRQAEMPASILIKKPLSFEMHGVTWERADAGARGELDLHLYKVLQLESQKCFPKVNLRLEWLEPESDVLVIMVEPGAHSPRSTPSPGRTEQNPSDQVRNE